ncbi:MAG TPA: hypothetical protein VGQ76_03470 [Thermoanaerobaculia bacterium]|jgi:hypothetical protein|nr:hypothetical protein [Thermoanaerobaculia bacterium]
MQVTVYFVGICTHVNEVPGLTRVLLVNAGFGMNVAGHAIPPHTAALHVPKQFVASAPPTIGGLTPTSPFFTWTMGGVQLDLSHGTGGALKTTDYTALPSLTQIAGTSALTLDQRVTRDGAAACEFRITHGEMDAFQLRTSAAVLSKLTFVTDAPPQLIITRIWDGRIATITLRSADGVDPVLSVSNTGSEPDTVADFLLHYGVTTFTPATLLTLTPSLVRAARDTELAELEMFSIDPGGLTIGCSNSTFP